MKSVLWLALACVFGCSSGEPQDINRATADFRPPSTQGFNGPDAWAVGAAPVFNADEWGVSYTGAIVSRTNEAHALVVPLDMPHGATLTAVSVTYLGAGGHAALPAGMPEISVAWTDVVTGDSDWVATVSDPSTTVVGYQTTHAVVLDGMALDIDAHRYRYQITVQSEYGDGALSGATFIGAQWQSTSSTSVSH